jgi:hypothetical protein
MEFAPAQLLGLFDQAPSADPAAYVKRVNALLV